MARGDQRATNAVSEQLGNATQDYGSDVIKVALCSDTYAASAAFTNFSQFTECSGTGYIAGGETSPATWTRSGSKSTLQLTTVSWSQNGAGPTDCRVAVAYNSDSGATDNDDVISVTDITVDGATAESLQVGPINVNYTTTPTLEVDL